jgi:hypothetical protein
MFISCRNWKKASNLKNPERNLARSNRTAQHRLYAVVLRSKVLNYGPIASQEAPYRWGWDQWKWFCMRVQGAYSKGNRILRDGQMDETIASYEREITPQEPLKCSCGLRQFPITVVCDVCHTPQATCCKMPCLVHKIEAVVHFKCYSLLCPRNIVSLPDFGLDELSGVEPISDDSPASC